MGQYSALWAKLGGQVEVIFKTQNKKIHFFSLFSKILETNIEPSWKEYLKFASTTLETVDLFEMS